MEETVFQKIIDRTVSASIVHETEYTLAFLDITPVHKGHALVIPKTPVRDIFDLSDTDAEHLIHAVVAVARGVKKATDASGVNIVSNNGSAAGQAVFHLHFHIIPRFSRDEFPPFPHTTYADDEEKESYARRIREAV